MSSSFYRYGVNVPGVRMVDAAAGALGIEWIEGKSVRRLLPGGAEGEAGGEEETEEEDDKDPLKEYGVPVETLMKLIGIQLAKMHSADVIHGDLTTSNMMLRHPSSFTSDDPKLSTELTYMFWNEPFPRRIRTLNHYSRLCSMHIPSNWAKSGRLLADD
ncbi:hypothetical protein H0H87_008940 [Tephrocybe sp. NHM501043]|nr:hypothetical protein H0H87_008940 [Tephrocybe sp. NHM501043]